MEKRLPVTVSNNSAATHLYRIAQEAVNNALRHSQASEIVLSLKQNGKELVLEVLEIFRMIGEGLTSSAISI